jgi:5-methyltetrahydropteroyltriglutamate--homocysteine methyltransferase
LVKSCDVGSLPLDGDSERFVKGAEGYILSPGDESVDFFEQKVLEGLLDKFKAGIDVPNFPQFRDMNEMFLSMMNGLEKVKGGYLETEAPSLRPDKGNIPEVAVIEQYSQRVQEEKGEPFGVKICVTGPYTLSFLFPYRDKGIFVRLGNVISQIVENNVFSNKHGRVCLVSVDEPVFGLQDDALIDFGSGGRENLQKAWESIFRKAKSKNTETALHLHSTTDELFWDVDSLQIIDSHVDDPLPQMKKTKQKLESKDKFLKASITYSEFDILIKQKLSSNSPQKLAEISVTEQIAEAWKAINRGQTSPESFLEDVDAMKRRLVQLVDRFGEDRILYAGPECGLKGYPTYASALECLKRVSDALDGFAKER